MFSLTADYKKCKRLISLRLTGALVNLITDDCTYCLEKGEQ